MDKFTKYVMQFEQILISKFQSEFSFVKNPRNGGAIYFDRTRFNFIVYKNAKGDQCDFNVYCSHFDNLFSKYITKARKNDAGNNHLISSVSESITLNYNQTKDKLFLENQAQIVFDRIKVYFNEMNSLDYFFYNDVFNSPWDKVLQSNNEEVKYAELSTEKLSFNVFYRKLFMAAMVDSPYYENILKLAWSVNTDLLLDWIKHIEPLDVQAKEILPDSFIVLNNFDILLKNKNLELKL